MIFYPFLVPIWNDSLWQSITEKDLIERLRDLYDQMLIFPLDVITKNIAVLFLVFEVSDVTIHRTSFIYAIQSLFFNNYYYLAKVGSFYILQFMSWWNGRRREEGRREQRLWRTIREEVHFRRPLSTDKKSAHKIVVRNCVDFDKAF